MVFDLEFIIEIIIALVIGGGIYYLYNNYKSEKIDQVYSIVTSLYEKYGDMIKKDNPQLAKECEEALKVLKNAMEDGEISIMEAFDITKAFLPLTARLVKYVKKEYEN